VQHPERVERLWPSRLRWRMRGAWLWPAFFGLTVIDGILIAELPPYEGTPPDLAGGVLLAGFANLFLLAVVAPFAGRLLRRLRPDLPRPVAYDYAGTALLAALTAVILVAGLAHRPAVAAEERDEAALAAAVGDYVRVHAPEWEPGLAAADAEKLKANSYRACVPGPDPRRWLCLIVDTDRRPPAVHRDESMRPNR
jgi:4-amino-4-deoxy-L-arabinose transferase-like glycosyltransferase